jgi:allantoin racemase
MRISIIHVNTEVVSAPYAKLVEKNFDKAKRDDTVISHRYVRRLKRATDTVLALPILLNKVDVVEQFLAAHDEGVDAAMVACSGDPGVLEARSIVSIPIVGPMEAALHLACMYGFKIGIVTVAERSWSEYCEQMTIGYGLGTRLAGVQRISVPSHEAFTLGFSRPEVVANEIARSAQVLIERGANAIVIGSAGLSVIASSVDLAQVSGVPIFDCLTAGLKMAELRADLHRKRGVPETCRVGYTEQLPSKDLNRLAELFGLHRISDTRSPRG